jgi:ABC-type iron transport system FetAB permease component
VGWGWRSGAEAGLRRVGGGCREGTFAMINCFQIEKLYGRLLVIAYIVLISAYRLEKKSKEEDVNRISPSFLLLLSCSIALFLLCVWLTMKNASSMY